MPKTNELTVANESNSKIIFTCIFDVQNLGQKIYIGINLPFKKYNSYKLLCATI